MTREREIEGHILNGMARTLWLHAYIMWTTEVEPPPVIHSETWDEAAPPTPPAAMQAARELADGIGEVNRLGLHPLVAMFDQVGVRRPARSASGATEADAAVAFGEHLASACLQTQDVPVLERFSLPYFKVELDDDGRHLSWDGGESWR
jgi:hypothetical protein